MMKSTGTRQRKPGRVAVIAANARSGLVNKLHLLDQVYHAQRAMGGYRYREKYKCNDLELAQHIIQLHENFRNGLVQLAVLKEAVESHRLIRWIVKRRAKRIASELDRMEGRE